MNNNSHERQSGLPPFAWVFILIVIIIWLGSYAKSKQAYGQDSTNASTTK